MRYQVVNDVTSISTCLRAKPKVKTTYQFFSHPTVPGAFEKKKIVIEEDVKLNVRIYDTAWRKCVCKDWENVTVRKIEDVN